MMGGKQREFDDLLPLYRWGDAPVQTMAAALFLRRDELYPMESMGYSFSVATHCPKDKSTAHRLNCVCDPAKTFDGCLSL